MSVPMLDASSSGARAGSRVDLYATGTGELTADDVVVLAVQTATTGSSAWSADGRARDARARRSSGVAGGAGHERPRCGETFVLAVRQSG